MDRRADDTPDDIRERMKLTRASVDNQLELLRLRRYRYVSWVAAAAALGGSLAAVIQLMVRRLRRSRRAA